MKRVAVALAGVAGVAVLVLAAAGWVRDHRMSAGNSAKQDAAILAEVPVYPGSTLVLRQRSPAEHGNLFDPGDLPAVTVWVWHGPQGVTVRTLANWYVRRLRANGWTAGDDPLRGGRDRVQAQRADGTWFTVELDSDPQGFPLGGPVPSGSVLIVAMPQQSPK